MRTHDLRTICKRFYMPLIKSENIDTRFLMAPPQKFFILHFRFLRLGGSAFLSTLCSKTASFCTILVCHRKPPWLYCPRRLAFVLCKDAATNRTHDLLTHYQIRFVSGHITNVFANVQGFAFNVFYISVGQRQNHEISGASSKNIFFCSNFSKRNGWNTDIDSPRAPCLTKSRNFEK